MIIHPITYPKSWFYSSKGVVHEVFLAEEAVGLAKALQWKVVKGPFQKSEDKTEEPEA